MARKRTQNYREMRADFDEDEERRDDEEGDESEDEDEDEDEDEEEGAPGAEGEASEEGEEGDDEDAPKKKKAKAKVKPKAKPKRTRVAKVTRMRQIWGVFNNSNQMVAEFEYPQRAEAEADAARRMADKKSTHFVQPIKVAIEEKKEEKKEK